MQAIKEAASEFLATRRVAVTGVSRKPESHGTETALTTALNTAYMAERIALFGIVVGIALLLSGIGFLILAVSGAIRRVPWAKTEAAGGLIAAPRRPTV